MAAPNQILDHAHDVSDSLMESIGEVQTTMATLHSTVTELINSMAEILKSMAEMKAALQTTTESKVTPELDLPPAPEKQPIAVDNSIDEKLSRYIHLKKVKVDIPVFDGFNVNLWIFQAERYLRFGNFTETEKIRLAYMSVEGPALIWFNLWEHREPFIDWNDFKSRLIDRFGGLNSKSAMERLLALKQEESVIDYTSQFEELASLISDTPELIHEAVFVNGLKEEIRDLIRFFQPKGIDNIISMARRLEISPFCRSMNPSPTDDAINKSRS